MKHVLLVLIALILITVTVGNGVAYAQDTSDYSFHFILPDGYVGAFRLALDESNGLDVKLENGRYTFEIPEGGTLKIKSFSPFAELHSTTAAYRNGKDIPYDPSGSLLPKSIALRKSWWIVSSVDEHGKMQTPVIAVYVIGTQKQADKIKRRLQVQRRA